MVRCVVSPVRIYSAGFAFFMPLFQRVKYILPARAPSA